MIERPVTIPGRETLHAILSAPAEPTGSGVLLLNAGRLHRVGPHRLYVGLARRLATAGHHVLRFDHAGVGESKLSPAQPTIMANFLDETRRAADLLCSEAGCFRLSLIGICGGGDTAFHFAPRDERVARLILVNGSLARPGEMRALGGSASSQVTWRYYRKNMLSLEHWGRLIAGRSNRSLVWKTLRQRFRQATPPDVDSSRALWRTLLARGVEVHLIYAEGSMTLDIFDTLHRKCALAQSNVTLDVLPNADHTFTSVWSQGILLERIMSWMEHAPPALARKN